MSDKKTPTIFFRFYFNDFRNKTGHLSCLERGVYLDAMLAYYSSGKLLPQEQSRLFRLVGVQSDEEKAALTAVLTEFFTKEDGMWRNSRCDEELIAIDVRREKTRKAREARWHDADEEPEIETDSVTDSVTDDDTLRTPSRTLSQTLSSSSSSSSSQSVKSTESKTTSKAFDLTVCSQNERSQEASEEQSQPQERQADVFSSLGDRTDEEQQQERHVEDSIGAHFANCTDIIDRLTDGELDQDDYHCNDGFEDWSLLSGCAIAAVDAKKERPLLGPDTKAALMRDVMKRMKKQHNLNVPEPWIPIMDAMQGRTSEQKAEKKQRKAEASFARPAFTEEQLQKMREEALKDRAPCQEKGNNGAVQIILRRPEERIKMGFTVLAPCTVKDFGYAQGLTGKPVWHRAEASS